jgi:hypothetical protein
MKSKAVGFLSSNESSSKPYSDEFYLVDNDDISVGSDEGFQTASGQKTFDDVLLQAHKTVGFIIS